MSTIGNFVPEAMFFEYDQYGRPQRAERLIRPAHETKGFWATVVKQFPEEEWHHNRRIVHLEKSPYDVLILLESRDDTYGPHFTTEALISTGNADALFELLKQMWVLAPPIKHLLREVGPEGRRRAMRIVRESFQQKVSPGDTGILSKVAVLTGVELTPEKLRIQEGQPA